ncbi:MAG: DUF1638 domain-containing protein [Sphingobacteriia bacterium]|nr:DUF1638 domain-containing protein [Sphingobacteriia bacterium]
MDTGAGRGAGQGGDRRGRSRRRIHPARQPRRDPFPGPGKHAAGYLRGGPSLGSLSARRLSARCLRRAPRLPAPEGSPRELIVPGTLCLRVCSNFRRDVETGLAVLGEEGVRVQAYPAVCTLRPGPCNLAHARETPPPEGCDGVLVLLGCDAETRATPPVPRVHLVKLDYCIHLLAGRDVLEPEMQAGAYLVTAGWLKQWREHIRGMSFDRETAGEFFHLADTDPPTQLLNRRRFSELAELEFARAKR